MCSIDASDKNEKLLSPFLKQIRSVFKFQIPVARSQTFWTPRTGETAALEYQVAA